MQVLAAPAQCWIHTLEQRPSSTRPRWPVSPIACKSSTSSFDLESRYNLWSGRLGGFFLALAYVGTDQSQVQRSLAGKSVTESRLGLLFNGAFKIPMQFGILFIGIHLFAFHMFEPAPLHFISFVLSQLPTGLVGQLIAVILLAAMSSISSELNALGTTTTVDIYPCCAARIELARRVEAAVDGAQSRSTNR